MLIHIFHDKMSDVGEVWWQKRIFVGKIGYLVGNYCTQTKARGSKSHEKRRSRAASTAATEQKRDKKTPPGSPRVHLKFYGNFIWGTAQSCAMLSQHTRRPCYRDDRRCAPVPVRGCWW